MKRTNSLALGKCTTLAWMYGYKCLIDMSYVIEQYEIIIIIIIIRIIIKIIIIIIIIIIPCSF